MNTLQKICTKCVERADAFAWKGKTGDKLAFEFLVGAATVLRMTSHPDAKHVETVVAMIISVRGLGEVRRIVAEIASQAKEG